MIRPVIRTLIILEYAGGLALCSKNRDPHEKWEHKDFIMLFGWSQVTPSVTQKGEPVHCIVGEQALSWLRWMCRAQSASKSHILVVYTQAFMNSGSAFFSTVCSTSRATHKLILSLRFCSHTSFPLSHPFQLLSLPDDVGPIPRFYVPLDAFWLHIFSTSQKRILSVL